MFERQQVILDNRKWRKLVSRRGEEVRWAELRSDFSKDHMQNAHKQYRRNYSSPGTFETPPKKLTIFGQVWTKRIINGVRCIWPLEQLMVVNWGQHQGQIYDILQSQPTAIDVRIPRRKFKRIRTYRWGLQYVAHLQLEPYQDLGSMIFAGTDFKTKDIC